MDKHEIANKVNAMLLEHHRKFGNMPARLPVPHELWSEIVKSDIPRITDNVFAAQGYENIYVKGVPCYREIVE